MSPRGERWFDQEAGPVVRLYALTKGRARPAGLELDVVDVVVAETPARSALAVAAARAPAAA